ncbi:hypothetical protein BEWA_002380 [Theileria equi strain WA]|uniref:Signal peptide containing protein n=1 Tax=Theileria equi strain WA TaxID=1537102 RepID=L0B0P2_THEEQ|nr:hypothetical protein BEWA_002380 [Theileria equi strain WA]AFZ80831.1 hypothetical protein BEWA_002380 [Theileria equi strain WA]|eukprot:XP_004830497.1 hypothetical protein BEWA_002380 [Theileria equi strain WA]
MKLQVFLYTFTLFELCVCLGELGLGTTGHGSQSPFTLDLSSVDQGKVSVTESRHGDVKLQTLLVGSGHGINKVLYKGKQQWIAGIGPLAVLLNVVYKSDELQLLKVQGSGESAATLGLYKCKDGSCTRINEQEYNAKYGKLTGGVPKDGNTVDLSSLPKEGVEIKKPSPNSIYATLELTQITDIVKVVDGQQVLWHTIGTEKCISTSIFAENEKPLLVKLVIKSALREFDYFFENIRGQWWPSTSTFYNKKIEVLLETDKGSPPASSSCTLPFTFTVTLLFSVMDLW